MDTVDDRYKRARERVQELRGFWIHLTFFILVNAFLIALNLLTSPDTLWFFYPLLGWGIGLTGHAVSIFGLGGWLGKDWEERKIRELMDKEDARNTVK